MSLERRSLPAIPRGIDVDLLNKNLCLYSDADIAQIKKYCRKDGRYRHYIDANQQKHELPYSVFVVNGKYIASYPGKKFQLGDDSTQKVKLAQDLDSGKWVVEKVVLVDSRNKRSAYVDEVEHEVDVLEKVGQAVTQKGKPVQFFRPFSDKYLQKTAGESDNNNLSASSRSSRKGMDKVYGSTSSELSYDSDSRDENEDGKYYLFMKRAKGMTARWWRKRENLPSVVRMDLGLALTKALMDVHEKNVLHRDVKPRNSLYDMFKEFSHAAKLVDFGLAVQMQELGDDLAAGCGTNGYIAPECDDVHDEEIGEYSVASDVYALGVSLGKIWGLVKLQQLRGDFSYPVMLEQRAKLHPEMFALVSRMIHEEADERPTLKEVLAELKAMKAALTDQERKVSVAVLDVMRYEQDIQNNHKFTRLFDKLGEYDIIQFFDSTSVKSDKEILKMKAFLEKQGFLVFDDVLLGSRENMLKSGPCGINRAIEGRRYAYDLLLAEVQQVKEQKKHTVPEVKSVDDLSSTEEEDDLSAEVDPRYAYENQEANVEYVAINLPPIGMDAANLIHPDAHELVGGDDVEPYSWLDCLGWFFNSIKDDVVNAVREADWNMALQAPGCFGMFGCVRPPRMQMTEDYMLRGPRDIEEGNGGYDRSYGDYGPNIHNR